MIDCSLDYLNSFSPDKEVSFQPDLLISADVELRSPQVELLYQSLGKWLNQVMQT